MGLSDRLIGLGVGVLIGPYVLGWLDLSQTGSAHTILEETARLTLGVGLMGVALRIPKGYVRGHLRSLALVLIPGMLFMWLSSGLLVYFFTGLALWPALLIGAILTPTDPIAATAIVTGDVAKKHVPPRLRHLISAESGLNDGLGLAFVLLCLLFIQQDHAQPLVHWLTHVLLWDVGFAIVIGGAVGWIAGKLLERAERENTMEMPAYLVYTLALALLVLGVMKLFGSDDLLAVFVAGLAFDAATSREEQEEEESIVDGVDLFFSIPIFALAGVALPFSEWVELGWPAVDLAVAVLLLRRLPFFLLTWRFVPSLHRLADAWFTGWFGPIGVAAMFYAMLVLRDTELEVVWTVASLLIATTTLAHGLTATAFSRWYARHTGFEGKQEDEKNPAK